MARVVRSINGSGQLLLRGGEVLDGRYHIDVSYLAVRRVHAAEGSFILNAAASWESVVEAHFSGDAIVATAEGGAIHVTLGGIVGREIAIVGADALPIGDLRA